ncbi:MAG: hypothetical protein KIS88_10080 [Anaerolineales bacterium]|nr:hypothetical protein [Anaerolineales bacterium]
MSLLDRSAFSRLRRNHGLEHASIHVLSRTHPRISTAGHSDPGGFWLLGELSTQAVHDAVEEALARLRAGEHSLAIHPNCGTNLVTASVTAGLGGAFALGSARTDRERLERLPLAILFAMGGLLLARPLGTRIQQRVTTSGEPGDLRIVEIRRSQRGRFTAHRVVTAG